MGYRGKAEPHPDHVPPKWLRVISDPTEFTKKDQRTLGQIRAKDWLLVHQSTDNHHSFERYLGDPHIWEHTHPSNRQYALRQRYYGYFPRYYPQPSLKKYAFVDHANNTEIVLEGANWADWDQRGRVIYARDGQIFAQEPEQIGTFARPLADFNEQKFESIVTPDWAAQW
jgi:hypothetical protein